MFKALSQRLKKASSRTESDLMLVRAWYSDVMLIAHSHVQDYIFKQASSVAATPKRPMQSLLDFPLKKTTELESIRKGLLGKHESHGRDGYAEGCVRHELPMPKNGCRLGHTEHFLQEDGADLQDSIRGAPFDVQDYLQTCVPQLLDSRSRHNCSFSHRLHESDSRVRPNLP